MEQSKRLYRSLDQRLIGGVCGGIGEYFDIDPSIVRLIAILGFVLGFGSLGIAYLVMWIVVPDNPDQTIPPADATGSEMSSAATSSAVSGVAADSGQPVDGVVNDGEVEPPVASDGNPEPVPAEPAPANAYYKSPYEGAANATPSPEMIQSGVKTGSAVFGIILMALGVLGLIPLLRLDVDIWRLWPLFILVPGLYQLVTPDRIVGDYTWTRASDAFGSIMLGLVLLGCTFNWISWMMWLYFIQLWPFLVIAGGIAVLGSALHKSWIGAIGGLMVLAVLLFSAALGYQGPYQLPFTPLNPLPEWPHMNYFFRDLINSLHIDTGVI